MKDNLTKKIGKTLTPPKAFLNWCYDQLPIYEWSNKQETFRSSSRTNGFLIKKRLTKASRLTFSTKFYSFAIILVSSTRIEIQSYDFWLKITNGKEELHYELTNFERFSKGEHIKAHYYNENWYEGLLINYGMMSNAYTNTKFYPNNWNEQLQKRSELRYLDLPLLYFREIANIYKYRLEIEFCQKINAPVLADEIMFPSYRFIGGEYRKCVDMRVLTMKWLKQNKWRIKNTRKNFSQLKMEEIARQRKSHIVQGIEQYLDYRDFAKIPQHVGFRKFQRWIIENEVNFKYYLDYISILKLLDTPLTNSLVLMPRNLQEKHDEAVNTFNQLKIELEEKAYEKRLEKIRKLEQEIDEYAFLVPKKLEEIVEEGKNLNHCVGGYVERHKKGETTIIFMRKKEAQNQSLYTIEYKNKHIVQIQGYRNKEVIPEKVREVANKWVKKIS
ncbi:TPA: PcfJ domain-containing protein [Enterococcus hirae]